MENDAVLKTGTTTVGLRTAEGVVLAADRRASLGGRFVSNKRAMKIEQVHPRAAVTMAGTVGGAQAFIRQLRAEANLYEARRGRPMGLDALAQTAGQLLRGTPASPVLGGVDVPTASAGRVGDDGRTGDDADADADGTVEPRVFSIDGAGGVLEDAYTASGSGTTLATGALERGYREDLSLEEGVRAAAGAVASALERDTASGNGITVARITADGVTIDTHDDVREVLQ
ncbi:proteasome subunit beta [Halomarina halobia]|uniref:Proteasome subunit beta n=1 Tax=Halomarina halobia TaxID=3033386 RepID=A0ABD6A9Z3_9EURY|nr:proteasome subunit beta [Halomarina sp. PSR21]